MLNLQSKIQRLAGGGREPPPPAEGDTSTPPHEPLPTQGGDAERERHAVNAAPSEHALFRREGDYWTLAYGATTFRLHHRRGLAYLAYLLQQPHVAVSVLDVIAAAQAQAAPAPPPPRGTRMEPHPRRPDPGDAGVLLDAQARAAYKQRLVALREELEEAQARHDLGRVERAQQERDVLTAELARGFGLGGRARHAPSAPERARINVVKGIKAAVAKIAEQSPRLAHILTVSITTGVFCSYTPPPGDPIHWDF
jgi:hypothetical protein